MNKNTGIIIGVVALIVLAGIYVSQNSKKNALMAKEQMEKKAMEVQKIADEKAMMEKEAMEVKDAMMTVDDTKTDSMMKKDETSMTGKGDTMMKAGSYEVYGVEKVMLATATHDVVLFFRAGWCPTCRAVDSDIKANLSKIPSSLAILDVNYDNSSALKQKYGVTYQHTFVQVDKDGNLIKKWSGSPTLAALVAEVK
jgi:thiol-disulfide isomerase/thioredoxin